MVLARHRTTVRRPSFPCLSDPDTPQCGRFATEHLVVQPTQPSQFQRIPLRCFAAAGRAAESASLFRNLPFAESGLEPGSLSEVPEMTAYRSELAVAFLVVVALPLSAQVNESEPVEIGSRRELFVDELRIGQLNGTAPTKASLSRDRSRSTAASRRSMNRAALPGASAWRFRTPTVIPLPATRRKTARRSVFVQVSMTSDPRRPIL